MSTFMYENDKEYALDQHGVSTVRQENLLLQQIILIHQDIKLCCVATVEYVSNICSETFIVHRQELRPAMS